jgi:tRNA/tmRNA/rRNA uracil-C5-methylase (TrmA/RlmC/RlmD family)
MKPPPVTLTILRLGAHGDGVAEHDGQPVFVPFALPGETVEAEVEGDRARLLSIVTPDPARLAAFVAEELERLDPASARIAEVEARYWQGQYQRNRED